jgi:DNA-binding response OmpR family regulator
MQPKKRRILCVDDNEDTCFLLTTLLEREGFETKSIKNVEQALELSRRDSFNLYILDAWFSQGSGTGLCRKIREFDPHTPIIVYSGAAFESDKEEVLHAGANAFVAKPEIEELMETIKRLLNF